jgi:pimeloyl-ACP methyl ester carboxylesterase
MARRTWAGRRWTAAALAAAAAVAVVGGGTAAGTPSAAGTTVVAADRTSSREARRVDAVPTPRLRWYRCYRSYDCATVRLPLDYDQPKGATTEVALLRYRALDRKHRLGTLFVNPGGPGGSGVQMAAQADLIVPELLARFDVVGFDPRGTNFSDQVACFADNGAQSTALTGFNVAFPSTAKEERATIASARRLGRACSTTGRPLSASMSTAEVARDLDVLRRAVGDRKLTYLGFSYGTYLGQVYANLFPDRFRALAIDGVIDPVAWRGTPATASRPQTDRLRSADGAYRALRRMLVLCDRAGGAKCRFAGGDPVANYDLIARRLRKHPLLLDEMDGSTFPFGYADLVSFSLYWLYFEDGYQGLTDSLAELMTLTEPPAAARLTGVDRAAARKALTKRVLAARAERSRSGFNFPYDNSLEAFSSVLCTDGANPADAAAWPAAAAAADRRAKYFGRLWTWSSVGCAERTWTARDEDAYRGSFSHRTAAPVLVIGSTWDPATNVRGAIQAARLLPNSRLVLSDNWGHTAYGTSDCAMNTVDRYLITGRTPPRGTRCHGIQPFTREPEGRLATGRGGSDRGRLPVVPPVAPVPR